MIFPAPPKSTVPVLETSRLILRGYQLSDFEALVAMWQQPAYYRYLAPSPPPPEELWKTLLRNAGHWAMQGFGPWAVEEKASGQFIGSIGFFDYKRTLEPPLGTVPEMGWVLAAHTHGQGYATEAVTAALAWADVYFDHARTVCIIHPDNEPSLRVAARFGYHEYARTTYKDGPIILLERPGQ